jgi:hypothetical protein
MTTFRMCRVRAGSVMPNTVRMIADGVISCMAR